MSKYCAHEHVIIQRKNKSAASVCKLDISLQIFSTKTKAFCQKDKRYLTRDNTLEGSKRPLPGGSAWIYYSQQNKNSLCKETGVLISEFIFETKNVIFNESN